GERDDSRPRAAGRSPEPCGSGRCRVRCAGGIRTRAATSCRAAERFRHQAAATPEGIGAAGVGRGSRGSLLIVQYWDASALVSLCVAESDTGTLRRFVGGGFGAWSVSAVEIASASERRTREGSLSNGEHAAARAALGELAAAWTEISALGPVRDRAMRLGGTHALPATHGVQGRGGLVG